MKSQEEILKQVTTFIFDVDGVLTPKGSMLNPLKNICKKDADAIRLAIAEGYRVAVISRGKSQTINKSLKNIGVADVYLGAWDKLDVFEDYVHSNHLRYSEIIYMGDNMPDYEIMKKVAFPACPADAAPAIKELCLYIAPHNGGDGAVYDLITKTKFYK